MFIQKVPTFYDIVSILGRGQAKRVVMAGGGAFLEGAVTYIIHLPPNLGI